jgi:hypothetical protein
MAHEIFLCYASRDRAVAEAVCAALESRQIKCWIAPRDVLPGAEWAETIVDALDESRVLVLVLSSNSNRSPQVIREVGRAAGNGIPIIPLRIEDVSLSKAMDFFVSRHHFLDALTLPLEKHLKRLADTVQQILGQKHVPQGVVDKAEAVKAVRQVSYCPKCGVALRLNVSFCHKCGTPVSESEEAKEAEEKAKKEAEEKAKKEAEEKAKKEAEEKAKKEAEEKAKKEAEEKAKKEAEKAAREREKKEAVKAVRQVSYCPKCGVALRLNVSFCHKCGTPVSESEKPDKKLR